MFVAILLPSGNSFDEMRIDKSMIKKTVIPFYVFLLSMTAFLAPASAESYYFDDSQSAVTFEVGYLAGTCRGRFSKFEGKLDFDRENPEKSSVSIVIQVESVDTDSAKRDAHLQEDDFFYSSKFPTITFRSEGFKKRGDRLIVTGPLTIRGVSKPISLLVDLKGKQAQWVSGGDALLFESQYELNRLDFGVGEGQPGIDERIRIKLDVKAFEAKR